MSSSGLGDHDNKDDPVLSDLKKLDEEDNLLVWEMIAKHRNAFMSRVFPSGALLPENEDVADTQLWCRPQEELDYIAYIRGCHIDVMGHLWLIYHMLFS